MSKFRDQMRRKQLDWKKLNLPHVQGQGWWNKQQYEHILPRGSREENLWTGIQRGGLFPLDDYLSSKGIQAHTGRDNLLSSWTLAANLYFPFGQSPDGRRLVTEFLATCVSGSISSVEAVELEWEHQRTALQPPTLLGETDGSRGTNQTSPDVAFDVVLRGGGRGVVLTEVKFTEHNFYACSIRKQLDAARKATSCHSLSLLEADPQGLCGQHSEKGRRYWDHLQEVFDWKAPLRWCPAATAGYQMFRQQALAEALAVNSNLDLVVSALAYHEGNTGLIGSLRRTGRVAGKDSLRDIRTDWARLFNGQAKFRTFSHQSWVTFVRRSASRPSWCDDWLEYVAARYDL